MIVKRTICDKCGCDLPKKQAIVYMSVSPADGGKTAKATFHFCHKDGAEVYKTLNALRTERMKIEKGQKPANSDQQQ